MKLKFDRRYRYNDSLKYGLAAGPEEWLWRWVVGMEKFPIDRIEPEILTAQLF